MRFNVPQFKGYGDAIQANQSMVNAFKNVGDASTDYLNREEQKKTNEWNKIFEADKFTEIKNQNANNNKNANRALDNTDRAFNYGVDQDKQSYAFKNKEFDYRVGQDIMNNDYRSNVFKHNVNQDGIRNSQVDRAFNNTVANQKKPYYQMLETANENGDPTYTRYNPNTGESFATALKPYKAPKEMTPYQQDSLELRKEMQNEKMKAANLKTVDAISSAIGSDNWKSLDLEEQEKALGYYNETGLIPKFNNPTNFYNPWTYGDKNTIEIPSAAGKVEQPKNKNKLKDGSKVDLSKEY